MKDHKDFELTRIGGYGLDINHEKHFRDIVKLIIEQYPFGTDTFTQMDERSLPPKRKKRRLNERIEQQFRKSVEMYNSYRTSSVDEQIRVGWTGDLHSVNEGPWVIFCEIKGISPTEYYGVVFTERRYESNDDRRKDNNDRRR
jgi:hypothetical protein